MRLAIVGCGAVAERCHLPALALSGKARPTILVDSNVTRAQELARRFSVPGTTDDYKTIFGQVDAAIVALPHYLHAPVSADLLSHGIHVLVEKPMATTTAECDTMIEAANTSGVTLAVGIVRRFLPSYAFLQAAIDTDLLGTITSFDIREGLVYNWPVASDFFFRREMAGGGVLIDTGAYTMDMVQRWFGECRSLDYSDDAMGGVEANCRINLRMESGIEGRVELSRTRNLRNTVIITGDRWVLETSLHGGKVSLNPSAGPNAKLTGEVLETDQPSDRGPSGLDPFRAELDDWIEAITQRRPPRVPGVEGRRAVSLMEACYRNRSSLRLPWESTELAEHTST